MFEVVLLKCIVMCGDMFYIDIFGVIVWEWCIVLVECDGMFSGIDVCEFCCKLVIFLIWWF